MADITHDIEAFVGALGISPTRTIRELEWELQGLEGGPDSAREFLRRKAITADALSAALRIKAIVGQINVSIHALGILVALPQILEPGEHVRSVTLGAGNTGRRFDLETDRRVAEFKFITWRGADAVRQDGVFKDFLNLLWYPDSRRKQLFLTGASTALSFLRGGRALSSVLSKNVGLRDRFQEAHGDQYATVGDFYRRHQSEVEVIDLSNLLPVAGD